MRKIKLLSTLLFVGAFALGASQGAFAATSATQTVTGTLGTMKQVEGVGVALTATIIPDDGLLSAALIPAFKVTTNTSSSQNMYIKAECNTTGSVLVNALSGDGLTGTTFLSMTTPGETGLPAAGAVTNAQSGAPVPASNGNVITYGIAQPTLAAGFTYTNFASTRWNFALAHKGVTNTSATVAAAVPRTGTYSFDDEPGVYTSILTMSFNP